MIKISHPMILTENKKCHYTHKYPKKRAPKGFTLIEMLVVLCIITLMSVLVMPNITSYFQVSLNAATRELASYVKDAYNEALLTGRVTRIVYDIEKALFWVESGPKDTTLQTKETREKEERKHKFNKPSEVPPVFNMEKSLTAKKQKLPSGVVFEDIFTQQEKEPIKTGLAYTHFFPRGLSEQTIIHLKDRSDHRISLVISSIIGNTDLYSGYIKEEDAFPKE